MMISVRSWSRVRAALAGCVVLLGPMIAPVPAVAQGAERPLLVEGRKTVYQRVLTRPGALGYPNPGEAATLGYPAFQPLYIFDVQPGWIQVGPSISGGPTGWVQAGTVVPWKQNIVAAFTNRAGRERQFLFESEARLRQMMEHETLRETQARMLAEVAAGTVPETQKKTKIKKE